MAHYRGNVAKIESTHQGLKDDEQKFLDMISNPQNEGQHWQCAAFVSSVNWNWGQVNVLLSPGSGSKYPGLEWYQGQAPIMFQGRVPGATKCFHHPIAETQAGDIVLKLKLTKDGPKVQVKEGRLYRFVVKFGTYYNVKAKDGSVFHGWNCKLVSAAPMNHAQNVPSPVPASSGYAPDEDNNVNMGFMGGNMFAD